MTESNETSAESRPDAAHGVGPTAAVATGSTTGGRPGKPLRALAVLLTVCVLVIGVVILWRALGDGTRRPSSRSRTTAHLPAHAIVDRAGVITTLPDVLAIIRPELSPQLRAGEMINGDISDAPASDSQTYIWISFNVSFGRYLRVFVHRSPDSGDAHADLQRLAEEKAGQHVSAGEWKVNTGSAKSLSGLGEEALSVSETQKASPQADADRPDRRYDIGGGYFCARFRNVVIAVDVMGADYPPNAAKNNVLHGTDMSYQESQREASPLIKAIIGRLS